MNDAVCNRDVVGAVGGKDMWGPRLTKGKLIGVVLTSAAVGLGDGARDAGSKAVLSGGVGAK